MKNIFYRIGLLLLLMGMVIGNSICYALLNPIQPFLPFYWVRGQVTKPGGEGQSFRTVTIYKAASGIAKEIRAITDGQGNFSLNIYELNYYQNESIDFSDNEFSIAVYKGSDGFGKNAALMKLERNVGFVINNIELAAGEGPIDVIVPEGTVPLTIERVPGSTDIKISWNPLNFQGPQLFVLTGSGIGEFHNDRLAGQPPIWASINGIGAFNQQHVNEGYIIYTGLEAAIKEVYIKGLEAGRVPGDQHPNNLGTYLSQAPAVGRFDYDLKRGNENLVSIPLIQSNKALGAVFGTNFMDKDKIRTYENSGLGSWPEASFSGGGWDNGIDEVDEKKGYWINVSADKSISIIGSVRQTNTLYGIKNGNENMLGAAYPKKIEITNGAGADLLGLGAAVGEDVIIRIYDNSGLGSWPEGKYSSAGRVWDLGIVSLESRKGFWINNKGLVPKDWTLIKPY